MVNTNSENSIWTPQKLCVHISSLFGVNHSHIYLSSLDDFDLGKGGRGGGALLGKGGGGTLKGLTTGIEGGGAYAPGGGG